MSLTIAVKVGCSEVVRIADLRQERSFSPSVQYSKHHFPVPIFAVSVISF